MTHPKTTGRKPLTENSKAAPLDPEGPSPSENSRLHAATHVQSDVTPEDYPADKRQMQVAAGTDGTVPKE
jgi:hypothetical protein